MSSGDPGTLVSRIEALEAAFERQEELRQIGRLRVQYCRYVDAKRWDDLEAILAPDYQHFSSISAESEPTLVAEGVEEFRKRLEVLTAGVTTVHACFMPELELVDRRSARGTWSMTDVVSHPTDAARRFSGRGHYEDEYRRGEDGRWRIAVTRLTRQRLDSLPLREEGRPPGLPSLEDNR